MTIFIYLPTIDDLLNKEITQGELKKKRPPPKIKFTCDKCDEITIDILRNYKDFQICYECSKELIRDDKIEKEDD